MIETFMIFKEFGGVKQEMKFNLNGESRCIRIFAVEFLYSVLSMFQLRCLYPFVFLMRITSPMYEIF